MNFSAKKVQFASMINAKVKSIGGPGVDDFTIFAEMADYLPAFKRLMDTSKPAAMDELCRRLSFAGPAITNPRAVNGILREALERDEIGTIGQFPGSLGNYISDQNYSQKQVKK